MKKMNDKHIVWMTVLMGMMAALAYVAVLVIRIPVYGFLKYEPKDVIITIGGLMFGPLPAFIISLVVSLLEMVTISETGWIGAVMNLVSTCSFACTASYIYMKRHTLKGAIIGLITGVIAMVVVMLLWNYFLTPIYMTMDRKAVAAMLPTVFLPFNALKGGLNAVLTMLLYKPLVITLRKADLIPASQGSGESNGRINIGVLLVSLALLVTGVLLILSLTGVI